MVERGIEQSTNSNAGANNMKHIVSFNYMAWSKLSVHGQALQSQWMWWASNHVDQHMWNPKLTTCNTLEKKSAGKQTNWQLISQVSIWRLQEISQEKRRHWWTRWRSSRSSSSKFQKNATCPETQIKHSIVKILHHTSIINNNFIK